MRNRTRRVAPAMGLVVVASLSIPLAAQAASTLSIETSEHLLAYKRAVTIKGRLSSGKSGVTVALRADRFPFDGFKRIATTTTNQNGRYKFRAKPSLGTRYQSARTTAPVVRSTTKTVYVTASATDFECTPCGDSAPSNGSATYRESYTVHFPPSLDLASRPMYFYWGQRNGSRTEPPSRVELLKTAKQELVRPGEMRVRFSHRFTAPGEPYNYVARSCGRDRFAKDGFGLPRHHHCGDQKIKHPAYNRYLG